MSILNMDASQEALPIQALQKQMQELVTKLEENTPSIGETLILLHKNIMTNEHLVHILDDDDIKRIHIAHEQHKGIILIQQQEKEEKKSKPKVGKITSL